PSRRCCWWWRCWSWSPWTWRSGGRRAVAKLALRGVALVYLAFLLVLPVGIVFVRTFQNGVAPVWDALTRPNALHAITLTVEVALAAVVANTIFGVGMALLLVRHRFVGRRVLDALLDLPIAVSPVVVGLALVLVYGRTTAVGSWFGDRGLDIIF